MALDPVCGRDIDPKQSQWLLSYQGKAYHFCSAVCKHRFNGRPAEYVEIPTDTLDTNSREVLTVSVIDRSDELALIG